MANEFIIKNGFHSKGDSQITGSLSITGIADVSASIAASSGTPSGVLLTANNLSDVANAGTSRTNLGVAIGSDVQAHSSVLTSLVEDSAQTLGGAKIFSSALSSSAFKLNNVNALSFSGNVLNVGNASSWTTVELGRETTDEIHVNGILKAEQAITASGDILLPNSHQFINFINNAAIYGRTSGDYPGLQIASGDGPSARIWLGDQVNTTGPVTASFMGLGKITGIQTIEPHPNHPLILRGGPTPNDGNDGVRIQSADASDVYIDRFQIESDSTNVDAYFHNINGLGINKTSGFVAELDVTGDINASGDITASKFVGDGSNLTNLPAGSTPTLQQVITAGAQANGDVVITGSLVISGSFDAFKLETDNIILGPSANNIQAGADNSVIIGHANVQLAYSGDRNVVIGDNSGVYMTSGDENVVIGAEAYAYAQTNNDNIAIGSQALNSIRGNGNVGIGKFAIASHDMGDSAHNVGIGYAALRYGDSGGGYNVALGSNALKGTGTNANQYNIGLGAYAGQNITSGDYNILIGPGIASDVTTQDKQLRIGSGSITTISASLATGDIIFPSTASADYFVGDGSQLTGVGTLTGNGVSTRVPFYNGTTSLTTNSAFVYTDGSKRLDLTGISSVGNSPLRLSNLQEDNTESDKGLVIDSSANVVYRTLGTNAYSSTSIPSVANGANNRIATFSGATAFNGESNLTFDGSTLAVTGNQTVSGIGTFTGAISASSGVYVPTGANVGSFASDWNMIGDRPKIKVAQNLAIYTQNNAQIALFGSNFSSIISGSLTVGGSSALNPTSPVLDGRIDAKNDVVAFSTSDKRLKDNITPIDSALDKVSKIQGIEFDWIPTPGVHGNEGHDVGVLAQQVEAVLPEVVTTRDNGYKAVKYEKIVPLLIESIKELKAEIEELKKR